MKNFFYDGFNSSLINTASYESFLEIPKLKKQVIKELPNKAVPFSKRKYEDPIDSLLVFYEFDNEFRDFISIPQNFIDELKSYNIISTPDCSVYRDMPLAFQICNIAISRSLGFYLQSEGHIVIPNVRWGDERTYTNKLFDIPPAFAGIPKHSVVSIGTYGCSRGKENLFHLEEGLKNMLKYLEPEVVIIYGPMEKSIFDKYQNTTKFHQLIDYTTSKKRVEV